MRNLKIHMYLIKFCIVCEGLIFRRVAGLCQSRLLKSDQQKCHIAALLSRHSGVRSPQSTSTGCRVAAAYLGVAH